MAQRYWSMISIAALLAIAVIGQCSSPVPLQQNQNASNPAHSNSAINNNPSVFLTIGTWADSHHDAIEALSAIGVLALTFGLVGSTVGLWVATNDEARITKEALIDDKKAFVFPVTISPVWEHAEDLSYNWRFRPFWRNSGETPTKGLRMRVACQFRDTLLPLGFDFDANTTAVIGTGFLGPHCDSPGGIAPAPPDNAITAQDLMDTQLGTRFLYLWGWARYYDVFPKTREHLTRFCWLIIPHGNPFTYDPNAIGQPPTPGILVFNYVQHPEGNCADEECG